MRAYVLLRHDPPMRSAATVHWDLMLDTGTILRTWALDELPVVDRPIAARGLPDHRRAYLEYEGPVSGDRGEVTRIERGQYSVIEEQSGLLVARLAGSMQARTLRLQRDARNRQRWTAWFFSTPWESERCE